MRSVFFTLNKALLCEWNWYLANERASFGIKLALGSMGMRGWCSQKMKEGYGARFWKIIRKNRDIMGAWH